MSEPIIEFLKLHPGDRHRVLRSMREPARTQLQDFMSRLPRSVVNKALRPDDTALDVIRQAFINAAVAGSRQGESQSAEPATGVDAELSAFLFGIANAAGMTTTDVEGDLMEAVSKQVGIDNANDPVCVLILSALEREPQCQD